jgi:hypothetical protein
VKVIVTFVWAERFVVETSAEGMRVEHTRVTSAMPGRGRRCVIERLPKVRGQRSEVQT